MRMDPFAYLQNRMNQLWREFDRDFAPVMQRIAGNTPESQQLIPSANEFTTTSSSSNAKWLPSIRLDMKESEKDVVILADLPGVPKESIKASVDEDGLLQIRAEKREEKADNDSSGQWKWRERHTGLVERSIQLPKSIDAGKAAHAEFKDGVLQMKFDKKPEKLGQAIAIE